MSKVKLIFIAAGAFAIALYAAGYFTYLTIEHHVVHEVSVQVERQQLIAEKEATLLRLQNQLVEDIVHPADEGHPAQGRISDAEKQIRELQQQIRKLQAGK